jgi:hypothetical protein
MRVVINKIGGPILSHHKGVTRNRRRECVESEEF